MTALDVAALLAGLIIGMAGAVVSIALVSGIIG